MECIQVSPDCPVEYSIYGYYPSLPANAFFAAWFGSLLVLNLIFGLRYRTWTYLIALGLGCVTETIGYIGRIIMHGNPYSQIGFQMQICCLIIGPAFNSAAIYLTLKHIVLTFGPEYSFLKPKLYTYLFITGDLLALVMQGVGGGMAATAGPQDKHQLDVGTNTMMAGIAWQVVTLFFFGVMVIIYFVRRWQATEIDPLSHSARVVLNDTRFRLFAFGIVTAYIAVFARCVYRIVEMRGGWGNSVMRDQPSYIALEGVMIAYASFVQTAFHPGFCFPQLSSQHSKGGRLASNENNVQEVKSAAQDLSSEENLRQS